MPHFSLSHKRFMYNIIMHKYQFTHIRCSSNQHLIDPPFAINLFDLFQTSIYRLICIEKSTGFVQLAGGPLNERLDRKSSTFLMFDVFYMTYDDLFLMTGLGCHLSFGSFAKLLQGLGK